ncbi:hypothetical protein SPRG_04961 [Saprolegnia parasitica CBS 223.65]|uniref:FHA domain-containing protein n=1 Tax=Saprolegnia parasitica (strain CBS 223.65) TaxID=695850 RepID=A0A067CGL1_SAPPC|nr:hypothetical protein SPRG_04961 [Saprolegnia parasitica CBS 223.65]KDO29894.1 hypothetical protein SPRG_04961 [Saprolegnia parasitica CBS 223.65]|eukprot:XP_012199489.1 hypothetical protein SPRG_04961 [Saprolegnia parasitica CBS 223.65]
MALESKATMDDDVAATPAGGLHGSTVSTYATTFQPPEWAVPPPEKSIAARFEVLRMNKNVGTHELGGRQVTVFGREQNGCDFVLANPSVSRKHATVIHCAKGGVYIVDLMSRHGTFVGKTKIPPHDPYLLHEGDVVTFGQSCRTYVLKGTDPTGLSQAVKKPWRLKSLVPRFGAGSSSHPTPAKKPTRKYNDICIKMVNKICSGTFSPERGEEFANEVSELDDDLVDDVAGLLVEKVTRQYANATLVILALLDAHVGLQAFENNLTPIVQVSQSNLDARKILQVVAEARIESTSRMDTPNHSDDDGGDGDDDYRNDDYAPPDVSYAPPSIPYAPPASTYAPPASTYAPPAAAVFAPPPATSPPRTHAPLPADAPHYNDDDEEEKAEEMTSPMPDRARQRVLSNEGKRLFAQATHSPVAAASGFSFITPSSPSPVAAVSAFGFITASAAPDDTEYDDDENDYADDDDDEYDDQEEDDDGYAPVEIPEGFLSERSTMDPQDFSNLWQCATVSEEWDQDLSPEYDADLLERCLWGLHVTLLSTSVVGGSQTFLYHAEQMSNGTIFLVEVVANETLGELSATFKWIELGLLYDDGHLVFIQLFKECLEPCYTPNHPRTPYLRMLEPPPAPAPSPVASVHGTTTTEHPSAPTDNDNDNEDIDDDSEDGAGEELVIDDTASFEAALSTIPELDPSTFEALWRDALDLDTIADTVDRHLPPAADVIAHFHARRVFCIAYGAVPNVGDKFFFYAQTAASQCLYFLELTLERESTDVTAVCKYAPTRTHPVQEDIAIWFIGLVEEILVELE